MTHAVGLSSPMELSRSNAMLMLNKEVMPIMSSLRAVISNPGTGVHSYEITNTNINEI